MTFRQRGGIEPLHVSMPRELKSRPGTSPTHPGLMVSKTQTSSVPSLKLGPPNWSTRERDQSNDRVVLHCVVLGCAVVCSVVLCCAVLCCAALCFAKE